MRVYDAAGIQIQGAIWTGGPTSKVPTLRICALPPGDYTVVEGPSYIAGTWTVTANLLDNRYLKPVSTTVVVRMGTSDRTLWFGNTQTGP